MKPKIFFFLCPFFLLILCVTIPTLAIETPPKTEQNKFTLEITDNLINLQAEQVSFKDILYDLEKKTGIKVKIFDGVDDKNVTLDVESLPIFAIHTILEKMELENFAVAYDADLHSDVIYVLSEGQDINKVLKGKFIIRPARFADGKNVNRIKGREIATISKGKNKVPIRYVKDEVILKFHLGVTEKEITEVLKKHNLVLIDDTSLSKIGYVKTRIPNGRDIIEVIKEIRKEYKVKVPEPNYIAGILTVNDPLYESQWYAPDTNFDKAWGELVNKSNVKVAVIDSGVYGEHPDLNGKILEGYNFINNDADAMDDHGHGTFVSGIIAATSNNIGLRGLYDYARILPVKVIDSTGIGTYEDAARGIIYAADNGAKVINLSIGGYGFSFMLQDAVDYALEKGSIVVAAGGNDGIEQPIYPAAYPDVIGVTALGFNGQILSSSNSGGHIDVSAPGLNILSTGINNDYVYTTGTSASTAMVSALAGLLVSEKSNLSSSFIEKLIMQSTKDLGEKGRDKVYGSGAIDAFAALKQEIEPFHDVAVRSVGVEPIVFEKDKPTYIVANIENRGTYKSETIEVVLYEIVGEERTEIGTKESVDVIDKTTVIFEWKPESLKENITFEAAIFLEDDANTVNNSKTTAFFSIRDSDGLYILYGRTAHQIIAYKAYLLLPANIRSAFASYIGLAQVPTDNDSNSGSTISEGAYEEDDSLRFCNHFWNTLLNPIDDDAGYTHWDPKYCDSPPYQSAYRRAQSFWDNWVIPYYTGIDNNGNPWVRDEAIAFWWLGRVAHLLGDMSIPDHVHDDPHPLSSVGITGYELYIKNNCSSMTSCLWFQSGSPTTSSDIRSLFLSMAEEADDFDSGDEDGEVDEGSRRSWGFSDAEYREIADSLVPEAIRHIAGLYQLFWNNTHPTLTVTKPGTGSGLVTSNPPAINCGSTCSHEFIKYQEVFLTASASSGSTFSGWSGEGCSGTGLCTITMSQAKNVTATFTSQTAQTGTLSVTTSIVNGTIYVDGSYKGPGSWSESVLPGSYTVSFGDVPNYITPGPQTVSVTAGEPTNVSGVYTIVGENECYEPDPTGWHVIGGASDIYDYMQAGPYCANGYNWHASDVDNDGYPERYMLVNETYRVWFKAHVDLNNSHVSDIILNTNQYVNCYDGACNEQTEKYVHQETFTSPSMSIYYPSVGAKFIYIDGAGLEWWETRWFGDWTLKWIWYTDSNGNGYYDDGEPITHEENYLVLNCGQDSDCSPGYYCSKPNLSDPTTYQCQMAQYTLTISSNTGGSVTSPTEGSHSYNYNTVVTITAQADTGYDFVNWSGNCNFADSNSANTSITMTSDCSAIANFISTDIDVCGTVSGTWISGNTYNVTCDIIVNSGQSLTIESGAVINNLENYSFTVNGVLTWNP